MATGTSPLSDQSKSKGKKKNKHREHDDAHGVSMGTSDSGEKFTFFFGPSTPFSQWHPAEFVVDGQKYNCAEQYMMHQKAVLFNDTEIAGEILKTTNPKEQKEFGRKVSNFNKDVWNSKCKEFVRKGNLAKFSQNDSLREALLSTRGSSMVEASPFDRIWGIGLGAKNWKATHRNEWRGTNWLGEILTDVRDEIDKDVGKTK